ncbi:hypothetical protein FHG87_022331 [Trinorchestia longiramus]|nr:hypothetical protein FHG87_022331 [Trinorchestia longiramus]
MENNINSTKEQITQISAEHNPQQIQFHAQPAGILKTIRKANKITNMNLQNYDGNKRTTKEKTKNRKKRHVFLIGDSIIQGQKTEFKRGLDEHKIICRPKIRLPEANSFPDKSVSLNLTSAPDISGSARNTCKARKLLAT